MRMRILLFSLCCLGLMQECPLLAQDTTRRPPSGHWDLPTCLGYAKKNNIQLNSLRLTEKTSEQAWLLSKAARYPTLYGTIGQTATHSRNASLTVGGFQTQASLAGSYSLTSAATLYRGGYIRDDIQQKNLEIESANLNILQTENDITLQITQAYLNILLAEENVVYVQDLLSSTIAQADQGKKEYDAGSIAKNAYIQLQAQVATDKYTLVSAQNSVRQNKLTLKQILQLPYSDSFDIVTPDTVVAVEAVPSLDTAEATALQIRPEIKNGQLGIQISRLDLAKARAGYLPTLTASGTMYSGYSNNSAYSYTQQLDNNFFQQIGLSLSIPIFTQRVNKTNVEEAKIEVAQSRLTLLSTQVTLSQTIEQAYITVLNAQSQYDAALEELKANQESFRVVAEELKVGAVNLVSYLEQKTLYTQAFQAYVQAKYNAALAIRIYDFYMGIAIKL